MIRIPSDSLSSHGDSSPNDDVTECVRMREMDLIFSAYQRTMREGDSFPSFLKESSN